MRNEKRSTLFFKFLRAAALVAAMAAFTLSLATTAAVTATTAASLSPFIYLALSFATMHTIIKTTLNQQRITSSQRRKLTPRLQAMRIAAKSGFTIGIMAGIIATPLIFSAAIALATSMTGGLALPAIAAGVVLFALAIATTFVADIVNRRFCHKVKVLLPGDVVARDPAQTKIHEQAITTSYDNIHAYCPPIYSPTAAAAPVDDSINSQCIDLAAMQQSTSLKGTPQREKEKAIQHALPRTKIPIDDVPPGKRGPM